MTVAPCRPTILSSPAVGSLTDRRTRKSSKEVREAVSDRGGGVRSRGEAAHEGRRQGKGTAIMKLTTMTQVTVDGVMQGNGGASDEDRRNGFERGGWARGKGDDETRTFINQTYQRADAFLFGRRTYELFAGSWGSMTDQDVPGWEPIGVALNEPAQVRRIDHAHRSGVGGHDRPAR